MIRINFGVSIFSKTSPGIPVEERVLKIPKKGIFESFSRPDLYINPIETNPSEIILATYEKYYRGNQADNIIPTISFGMLSEQDSSEVNQMYLLWIEERGDWNAIWHREWCESGLHTDESETGPFKLDDYCRTILAQAYNIPKELSIQDISKMSPSELEKLTT